MELLEKGTSKEQLTEQLLKGDVEKGILHRSSFYDFFFNPTVLGKELYTIVKSGQYMILKTFCSFLALLLDLFGVYGDGEFQVVSRMAVAAIAHIYVFPAKPYQFVLVSPCGKITSMQTIAKANLENKEKKPTIVEQKKACFEAPVSSITESVQDVAIGGGEHL